MQSPSETTYNTGVGKPAEPLSIATKKTRSSSEDRRESRGSLHRSGPQAGHGRCGVSRTLCAAIRRAMTESTDSSTPTADDSVTDEQRQKIRELMEQPRSDRKPKGPVRLSEEDIPLRRSSDSTGSPGQPPRRGVLFTTEDDPDDEGRSPMRPSSVRGPGGSDKQIQLKSGAMPLPANRTRYYEE